MRTLISFTPPDDLPIPGFVACHQDGMLCVNLDADNRVTEYEVWLGEAQLTFSAEDVQAAWARFLADAEACAAAVQVQGASPNTAVSVTNAVEIQPN